MLERGCHAIYFRCGELQLGRLPSPSGYRLPDFGRNLVRLFRAQLEVRSYFECQIE